MNHCILRSLGIAAAPTFIHLESRKRETKQAAMDGRREEGCWNLAFVRDIHRLVFKEYFFPSPSILSVRR